MKKIIYAFLICLPALLISCDDNNPNNDRFGATIESGWVEFAYDSSATISGVNQIMIPVELKTVDLNTPVNKNGFDVSYEVTGVAGAQVNNLSYSGTVNIPAGELVGNIVIDLPQGANASCLDYTVKLLSTNKGEVTVGLDDTSVTSHNLRIGNTRDSFLGTYEVVEDSEFTYNVTVTAGAAPNELIISNLYDVNVNSKTSVFLGSTDDANNISFPEFTDNLLFTSTNAAQGEVFVSNDFVNYLRKPNNTPADFVPSFYNPCTQEINLNFFLILGENQELTIPESVPPTGPKSINVVMTKI